MSNRIDSQDNQQNNGAVVDFPETQTIDQQASEWLAKLDAENPSAEVLAAFKDWVNATEAHRIAFEEMVAFWDDMNILTQAVLPREQLQAKAIQKTAQEPIQELIQEPNQTALTRLLSPLQALFTHSTVSTRAICTRAISTLSTKAAFATVMLTIGLLITTSLWSPAPKLYITDIGEQKTIELADHSIVQLNTNSRLEVDYSDDYRRLTLVQGEAHFDVAHNPDRPFEVYAGQGLVRAIGTSFTVHMRKIDVEVIVTEGTVEFDRTDSTAVAKQPKTQINVTAIQGPLNTETGNSATGNSETSVSTNPAKPSLKVEAGNMLTYSANDLDDIKQLVASQIEQQLAWRKGMLMFQGEPLQNVVDEVSRYTDLKIIIPERSAREMKVGGLFKVGDTESLFEALRDGFDIHVKEVSSNVVYLISNENR